MATLPKPATSNLVKGKKHISFHKNPVVARTTPASATGAPTTTTPTPTGAAVASNIPSAHDHRKRLLCEASPSIIGSCRANKLRRLTPGHSYSENNDDDDDDEDDDIFFGISPSKKQQPNGLIPLSPPPIVYSSSEEEEDEDDDEDDVDGHNIAVTASSNLTSNPSSFYHKRSRTLSNSSLSQHRKLSRSHSSSSGGAARRMSLYSAAGFGGAAAGGSPCGQGGHGHHRRRRSMSVPESDQISRQRCFDYLVSAIDAVWAQYCDCTSFAESEIYDNKKQQNGSYPYEYPEQQDLPCSPVSLCEEDMGMDEPVLTPNTAVSEQPTSVRLMNLKERLLKAKYFFVDLLETLDMEKSAQFWHRWDLVKYATIELVEEADDDETIEDVSAELEEGRYYGMRC
ncbi:hypothetical protein AWJ20_1442 [Sugiyamaella lignohabitans]|uniref:Uncharacterized protein n=1 Tax=Sugiyamaella lignohabitans TaxID=796027 RepID=A0A167DQ72_9ASCO|nr:uncharacterized protein AWJ20_1442 [Sugiyamaella lignohabitans]ANB13160.1 hypothetical protein AWJ20_1442 [Sugiyamaella lignohabitans]